MNLEAQAIDIIGAEGPVIRRFRMAHFGESVTPGPS